MEFFRNKMISIFQGNYINSILQECLANPWILATFISWNSVNPLKREDILEEDVLDFYLLI